MLVHRKNMIRVTVGWTNQFIMNNPKIQMSEGDALCTDPIQQNQRRPQQGGTFSPELRCYRLVSPKSLGQSLPGGSSKAANLVHLEQLFDLYMWGLSAGSGELPGFPQWQLLPSVCPSSSQPLPGIWHLFCFWAASSYWFYFNSSLGG